MVSFKPAPQRAVNKQQTAIHRPGRFWNHAAELLARPGQFWRKRMMYRSAPTESRYLISKLCLDIRFRFPTFR